MAVEQLFGVITANEDRVGEWATPRGVESKRPTGVSVSTCLYYLPFRFVTCRDIASYRSFYSIVQAEIADQAVQVTSL
jgi:hypothetical protein